MHRQDTEEQTEEEYNREIEQTVLNRLRKFLCDNLEPERFFPYLQAKEYLDPDSCEQIRNAGTTRARVNKMMDILIRSGSHPLKVLIRAIEKDGPTQKFVTDKMKTEHIKVSSDPANMRRLEEIRVRYLVGPTRLFVDQNTGQPPPYRPPDHPQHFPELSGHPSPIYHPSTFVINPSSVGIPVDLVKTPDLSVSAPDARGGEQLQNGIVPLSRFRTPIDIPKPPLQLQDRRPTPSPSDTPDSILARFPGSFHNSDFPPSYEHSVAKDPDHRTLVSSGLPSQAMTQILSDQNQAEIKISLHGTNPTVITHALSTSQEKELSKCNSLQTDVSPVQQWNRCRRVPSEHDASVVYTRNSPTNASPTPLSAGNSESTIGASTSPKPLSDDCFTPNEGGNTPTGPKVLRSVVSCHTASIQPSCFTSSIFDKFESSQPAGTSQDSSKNATVPKLPNHTPLPSRPHVVKTLSHFAQYSPSRQYSTLLEPIPSIEVENSENQMSTTRLPPTEHDDTSIISQNVSDDETSSLEISTDSDASDQQ